MTVATVAAAAASGFPLSVFAHPTRFDGETGHHFRLKFNHGLDPYIRPYMGFACALFFLWTLVRIAHINRKSKDCRIWVACNELAERVVGDSGGDIYVYMGFD